MGYFTDHYARLSFPLASPESPGFRNAQLGAVHAIASHFTIHRDPAVIVMPTGSGKTAVLMTVPFLLRSDRVLVVTPSVLVRGQIRSQWAQLRILKELGALPADLTPPQVVEVKSRIASVDAWRELAAARVVVGTPWSVSPAIEGVAKTPEPFFDLILIDEAHHSPARIWNALTESFPGAKRVLFTATPFRQDQKEIRGRFAYVYPVAKAFDDGIFGEVEYIPVLAEDNVDRAIAIRAQEIFQADRAAGLRHYLFVRTDSKKRAGELLSVYEEYTDLHLRVVHSGYSLRWVERSVKALEDGELDGIICVDMLGEGFDLPNLKIAAIHAPHKSLAVTLQFIGRFARTNAPDIGAAKFIAAPADIKIETERLFKEGAVWREIILGLGDERVRREIELREQLETFRTELNLEEITSDLSLYSLRPYHHVKILRPDGPVDLRMELTLARPFEVIHREVSDELNATVFLTVERNLPRWANTDRFARTEFDVFVVYHDTATGLLFICASRRLEPLYEEIAEQFCPAGARRLPLSLLNRVLRRLSRVGLLQRWDAESGSREQD
jgi:superfamily II DNA or RNA helicase